MIKIIALLAMLVDHACIFFFPEHTLLLRSIGAISFPLFAWCIVQGLKNTSNLNQYIVRLLLCCMIAQPLYAQLFPDVSRLNDLFTLLSALAIILLVKQKGYYMYLLAVCLVVLNIVSIYILIPIFIYEFENNLFALTISVLLFLSGICFISGQIYPIYALFFLPLIQFDYPKIPRFKPFFYAAYPGHFLVILLLMG